MISEEAKSIRRAYLRSWRKKNPDLVRASQDRYWERQAARFKEMSLIEKAHELKARGMPVDQISEILGITQEQVSRLLSEN
ncbi:MAG: hypothetical protein PHD61_05660 [Bacteroidales bacterium]|nr:hypothetical protein [Lentimicrobiaceae bacterium]MDD5694772.1 hypothetical protein [Bacteroidales bacterium]